MTSDEQEKEVTSLASKADERKAEQSLLLINRRMIREKLNKASLSSFNTHQLSLITSPACH
ncbi:MAG TPA: hypothetical protein VNA19_00525, partial [Pyrinomonadaceae bacterium]|nr:hypothetical protein [Pyrinomonadaceae bacterium]